MQDSFINNSREANDHIPVEIKNIGLIYKLRALKIY